MASSRLSLLIIALVVVFWLYFVFKITVLRILKLKKADRQAEISEQVAGTVKSSTVMGSGKFKVTKIEVEFPNFNRALITEEFKFADSKPEERRYEVGKRVYLLVNRDAKPGVQRVKMYGGKTMIGKGYLLFSALLISFAVYGTWYLHKATLAKAGGNLSNADVLFANNGPMPAIGIVFIAALVLQLGIFKAISRSVTGKSKGSDSDLKYFGEKVMATITGYKDTNVMINNNPMVKFNYTFKDKYGTEHPGEDKLVIGKLEIGRLPEMTEKEVFYLPDMPDKSKFTENLKPQSFIGCLNGVLLFEAFVFSCILIGMYLDGIR
jgi:hypothetical protein